MIIGSAIHASLARPRFESPFWISENHAILLFWQRLLFIAKFPLALCPTLFLIVLPERVLDHVSNRIACDADGLLEFAITQRAELAALISKILVNTNFC